ncbi:MAG: ATP-dependent sacrificial sulfur transferase LarE [Candidatus Zixiibacteriota bacterium]|nr:MAG: ATP-dependent sacrificial sulfur transferase LarE [candidate division Zixibacteria bacterium]
MQPSVNEKYGRLKDYIRNLGKVVIGFSGGVDSTLILKASIDASGKDNVWAVTGDSESLMPEELELCRRLAADLGLGTENFIEIKTDEMSDPNYRKNPIERCFYCKTELFGKLQEIAKRVSADHVLDGSNADDINDWRPGRKAGQQLKVISPLAEVGITKNDVREIAREIGLPNWEKPSLACLASRIPYGSEITGEKLYQVAEAERFLKSLGFTQLRVRHHGKMARLEFLKDEMGKLYENGLSDKINSRLKALGFTYVTVDLQGYRSGSMNENINRDALS